MVLQNLHTHSIWCDGQNSPEDIVNSAISQGFDSIGFSSHSYMFFSPSKLSAMKNPENYKKEIFTLKERYKDKIKVFCGIEYELYSDYDCSGFDYTIGSCHYLKFGNEYVAFERPIEVVREIIENYFNGDAMKFALSYYETLIQLPLHVKADVIGHFDLVTKHVEKYGQFNTESRQYKQYVLQAIDVLIEEIPLLEINTGAIARGYRSTPYPSEFVLKEWKKRGGNIIITSDCHNAVNLKTGFDDAFELAKKCGFKEYFILTEKGFTASALD